MSGDGAIVKYSRKFGDGMLDTLEVTKEEIKQAYKNIDKNLRQTKSFV